MDKQGKKLDKSIFDGVRKGLNAVDATDKKNRKKFAKLDQKVKK